MSGNFSQFGARERQYSDTVSVQAPVEDTSSATALSAFASALGTVGNLASSYGEHSKNQKRAEAAALEKEYENRYDYAIDKVSSAMDSGEMNSTQARTFLTKTKRELISMGASADSLNELEAGALKTLTGKLLAEGTEEEAAQRQFDKDFQASGYNDPEAGPEQQEINKSKFRARRSKKIAQDEEIAELALISARNEKNKSVREEAEAGIKAIQKEKINDLVVDMPESLNNEVGKLRRIRAEEEQTLGTAKANANFSQRLEQVRNSYSSVISREGALVEGGLPVQTKAATDTLNSYIDTELKYLGDAEANKFREQTVKANTLKNKVMLSGDSTIALATAASELLDPALVSGSKLSLDAAKRSTQIAQELLQDNPRINVEGLEEYDKVILTPNLEAYTRGELKDTAALKDQVSGFLKYSSDALTGGASLKDKNLIVKRMTSPQFGQFVRNEGLTNDDIANAAIALGEYQRQVTGVFQGFVDEQLGNKGDLEKFKQRKRGKFSSEGPVTIDNFDLEFKGGKVIVVGDNAVAREVAKEINDRASTKLTNVVLANANLEGTTPESVAERWIPELLPSKYGEQDAGEETATKAPSKEKARPTLAGGGDFKEGGRYKTNDGVVVTYRNGKFYKE